MLVCVSFLSLENILVDNLPVFFYAFRAEIVGVTSDYFSFRGKVRNGFSRNLQQKEDDIPHTFLPMPCYTVRPQQTARSPDPRQWTQLPKIN